MKYQLTIKLKDGSLRIATYDYLIALARQEAALKEPNCLSAEIEENIFCKDEA